MERVDFWLDVAVLKRWEKAAEAAGQTLEEWLNDALICFFESTNELDS